MAPIIPGVTIPTNDKISPLLKVKAAKIIYLPKLTAPDGSTLSVGETGSHIPFEIKRFYYIYNFENSDIRRGGHAHKSLHQVFFSLHGNFVFHLDDGTTSQDVPMTEPNAGLYVGPALWHDMIEIAAGSVILAVASDLYQESDYIRNYQDFMQHVADGGIN